MAKKDIKKGLFITFEGFEGSGKTTQIRLLDTFFKKNGFKTLLLREPGSTKIGERIRDVLLDKKNNFLCAEAELLLYLASRAQLVKEKITPAIRKGMIVLCDRFHDATLAYQGFGLGLDRKLIDGLGRFVTAGLRPDLTILLDIPVRKGLRRAGKNKDRIEMRPLDYHSRVRSGYLKIAQEDPHRVKVVKVRKTIDETHEEIKKLTGEICLLRK